MGLVGGIVVRTSDSWSIGREFKSWLTTENTRKEEINVKDAEKNRVWEFHNFKVNRVFVTFKIVAVN